MLDFKKIGGEIISAPLNENFRKLRNDISIINTNLVFDPENSVVDTKEDMKNLEAVNGQWCYVVATGELFRYTTTPAPGEENWYKIGDFGKTFRQGFLNSGLVLMDGAMSWNSAKTKINIPESLVYFKAEPGDEKYVMGMYRLAAQAYTPSVTDNGIYSIFIDCKGKVTTEKNLPTSHDVSKVYLGSFTKGASGWENDLFTMPDMAYTSDRSYFTYNGAQVQGRIITNDNSDTKINLSSGLIYDEGINYTQGKCDEYPVNTTANADYHIKNIIATNGATVRYMAPVNMFSTALGSAVSKLDGGYYYKNGTKTATKAGQFTIQRYVIMPNGECRIIYGEAVYNSMDDAVAHFNDLELFNPNTNLFTEVGRIALCNNVTAMNDPAQVQIANLTRLSTVGSLEPEFSDTEFMIYRGDSETSPNKLYIDLDLLSQDAKQSPEKLYPLGLTVTRHKFYAGKKYNANGSSTTISDYQQNTSRKVGSEDGYAIADNADVELLRTRVNSIEQELWKEPDGTGVDNQGVRRRLELVEDDMTTAKTDITNLKTGVNNLEANKAHAETTINKYKLTNTKQTIDIKTGDIAEGNGNGSSTNLWYTDARVTNSTAGKKLDAHIAKVGTGTASDTNIHGLSTQDITEKTNYRFVNNEEKNRINTNKLPNNTKDRLADLEADKLSNIPVYKTGTNGTVGTFEKIEFNPAGVGISFKNNTYYRYECTSSLAKGNYYVTIGSTNYSFTTTEALSKGDELLFKGGAITQKTQYTTTQLTTTTNSATGTKLTMTSYTDDNTLVLDIMGHQDLTPYMTKSEYAHTTEGVVKRSNRSNSTDGIYGAEDAGSQHYYGTGVADANGKYTTGFFAIPKGVTTTTENVDKADVTTRWKLVPEDDSIEYGHLTEEVRNKLDNRYHEVYRNGTQTQIDWKEVDEWNFGTGLVVDVTNHRATLSVDGKSVDTTVMPGFHELTDVNITYTGNKGKALVVNQQENGLELTTLIPQDDFMTKDVYVAEGADRTKVKHAVLADKATNATNATTATNLNGSTCDDNGTGNKALWSAAKIIANTTTQIKNEGVNTFTGTSTPSNSTGKDGDLFILTN